MDRPLKFWEFILGLASIFIVVSGMIYNRGTMDAANQIEIINLKMEVSNLKKDVSENNKSLTDKIDEVNKNINNVLVVIQNKQDRKNVP